MDNNPFETELEAADAEGAEHEAADGLDDNAFEAADAGDGFEQADDELAFTDDAADEAESADAFDEAASGDSFEEGADEMALWNAFEEELADGLDAADEDEFLGRLLGGLGRAGGLLARRMGGAAGMARRVAQGARRFGQVAGQAGRVAARVSPAALAAARMARMLGAPGLASGLQTIGRGAGHAAGIARNVSGVAGGVGRGAAGVGQLLGGFGQAAGGIGQAADSGQALLAQISQLIGGGGNEFEDFDAMAELYEDGVDEALPGMVGLAARAAARGLGFGSVQQLSQSARRALVRGVASAARELMRGRDRRPVRVLPRLAHAAGRTAARTAPTAPAAAQAVRRGLPRTARNLARNPQALRRAAAPAPLARPADVGRGRRSSTLSGPRTFRIDGPVMLTITPR